MCLMLAALFGVDEILFYLGKQASKVRLGWCGHGNYGALSKPLAPPSDLLTGLLGLTPFLTAGASTQRGLRC